MRYWLSVATMALIGGCGPQGETLEAGKSNSDESAAEIRTASACRAVRFEGSVMTHCTADPKLHTIRTALADSENRPYRSLPDFAARRGADAAPVAFAVNAGMFDQDGNPVGYYVEDSERKQELNRNDGPGNFHMKPNGVFYVPKRGNWRVRTSEEFYSKVLDRPLFGTQSGPMLVIDGKLHPEISEDGESRKTRNGVGISNDGRAHFVISEAPVSFGKLARYFRDEAKTPNALFLDGGVSSLWDPANDRMDAVATLGPLLVVEKKQ